MSCDIQCLTSQHCNYWYWVNKYLTLGIKRSKCFDLQSYVVTLVGVSFVYILFTKFCKGWNFYKSWRKHQNETWGPSLGCFHRYSQNVLTRVKLKNILPLQIEELKMCSKPKLIWPWCSKLSMIAQSPLDDWDECVHVCICMSSVLLLSIPLCYWCPLSVSVSRWV